MSRTTIARREIDSLSREKTILLALVIQLVIAGFSSFLVVGLTSLYDPGAAAGDVVVGVTGEEADELVAAAVDVDGLETRTYDTRRQARTAFERNDVQAVAHVESVDGRLSVSVEAPQASVQKTLIVVQVRAALERLERLERRDRSDFLAFTPLPIPEPVDASPYFGFTYTILVPLLLFLPVFISGAVVVDSLTEEMERGTIELLRVAPVSVVEIFDGKAGVLAALAPAQLLLWVALLSFNGIQVANVLPLVVLSTAAAAVAVSFAALLAVAVGVRQRAQLTYSFGMLAAFAATAGLPEHPATTVALFAIDSATTTTYAHLAGYVALALVFGLAVRRYVGRVDPEELA